MPLRPCRWGSHETLITTYQFGDLFPTAAPTEHPTRYPSPEPSKRPTGYPTATPSMYPTSTPSFSPTNATAALSSNATDDLVDEGDYYVTDDDTTDDFTSDYNTTDYNSTRSLEEEVEEIEYYYEGAEEETAAPVTSKPTAAPVTSEPTAAPVTSEPTASPTVAANLLQVQLPHHLSPQLLDLPLLQHFTLLRRTNLPIFPHIPLLYSNGQIIC